MTQFAYRVDFHAVGQGLFSSGRLRDERSTFRWVYDCGTSSSQSVLASRISGLAPTGTMLDLVVISHFDRDHISGLVQLLQSYPVGVLLLPALSLERRLVIAYSEGLRADDVLMQFYLNPAQYLADLEQTRIQQIVLVPESEDGSPPSNEGPVPEETSPDLGIDLEKGPSDFVPLRSSKVLLRQLRPGGRLVMKQLFEFVPYNDSRVWEKPTGGLSEVVAALRVQLTGQGSTQLERQDALNKIQAAYDQHFGRSSVARNMISLFVFAGPVAGREVCCIEAWPSNHGRVVLNSTNGNQLPRPCILYTGDGCLDTPERLVALTSYLGGQRISRLGCLQVMHHGAESCWHPGVAEVLRPDFSVFSSDPKHRSFGHPHAPVVRDFLPFGPFQVDKSNGLTIVANRCYRGFWYWEHLERQDIA